ncbi:alpha/beta fold hydrolase [Rhodoplanes sp. TEM]|uniref:Alpha/beta fold hydrolase n=1 Tax=Rhodoplanes tepidamans TaxID=200616 RepID=A0ABT5JD64_RHOTP|nr:MULTISPECIES: alpha/beta fold hydrolase [Rhodoplanes]MDC7787398.1 alpha/beta fold hydrolase [Rhodoplanes tepidamans]MDC7985517.1 alpha/beta fold hydrolase [Rhodoplanes sp. TEM]MDQ0358116.1 3-oxoadipate enol-lactonase [Rhodoplanes tepidamans]
MTDLPTGPIALHVSGYGPPLVLLHGLGGDHGFWDFAAPLGDRFRLVAYDLPGHGDTAVPDGPYTIEDLSQQLADLFRAQHIGRAHVAGISLGGLIAQHFAAHFPTLVDRLVLIDTIPRYTVEMRAGWTERAAAARAHGVAALTETLLPIWFSDAAIAAGIAGVGYLRDTLARCPAEGYALACEALANADLLAEAGRIAAPTLVVCGSDDRAAFVEAAHWLAATIPHARSAVIPGTRHASVLERPDLALPLLREFLGGE